MAKINERLNKIQALDACHNCFKDPYANLLLAIYVQAVCDSEGYIVPGYGYNDGSEARTFCEKNAELPHELFDKYGRK